MKSGTKLVCGIGINDYTSQLYSNNKPIKSYLCWLHMIERCYSTMLHIRRPNYIGWKVRQRRRYLR